MDDCYRGCEADRNHYCPHRFNIKTEVIYLDFNEGALSDLNVVRHFRQWIRDHNIRFKGKEFILVSRDYTFIRAVRSEYRGLCRRYRKIHIQFGRRFVIANRIKIAIRKIRVGARPKYRPELLKVIIATCNQIKSVP